MQRNDLGNECFEFELKMVRKITRVALTQVLGMIALIFSLGQLSYAQCTLSAATDTEAEVLSCLSTCGCTEVVIPTGVTINMAGDWDLTGEGAITFTIQGSGSLVFSGAGGGRDELFLASGSVLIIEDTGNSSALASSPPSGGNTRVEIGAQVYQGNDFDDIILAGGADENGPLPITLADFSVSVRKAEVVLYWETTSEVNNDFFTLERSKDAINYEVLGVVDGAGNSNSLLSYSFSDKNPFAGQSFYRLRQTDFDGTTEVFRPLSVFFTSLNQGVLSIAPNPVVSGSVVNILTGARNDEELEIDVYNSRGVRIQSERVTGANSFLELESDITPGLYIIRLTAGDVSRSTKLLIQ